MKQLTESQLLELNPEELLVYGRKIGIENLPTSVAMEYLSLENKDIDEDTGEFIYPKEYLTEKFEIIPHSIIRNSELSNTAKLLFMALKHFSRQTRGRTYVGDQKLAWWLDTTISTIQKKLIELEKANIIKRHTKYDKIYNRKRRIITFYNP